MKLTKENIYINLQGKTEEELTDLYEFLKSSGEKPKRTLIYFLGYEYDEGVSQRLGLDDNGQWSNDISENKQEVTIQQLKEIIKPETIQEKAIRLENELNEVKQQIEEENKPKPGDYVYNTDEELFYKKSFNIFNPYENKITNPELIKLLEQEIK